MNEHKLLRMIEEAGFDFTPDIMNKLQKFQNLIWVEREECAKVCDEQEKRSRESSEKARRERDQFMYHHCAVTAKWNAAAIRARGQE